MIINFKLKGMASKKNEIFGEFLKGGFSSKINYFDHLHDLNQIRIDNNQNFLLVFHLIFNALSLYGIPCSLLASL